MLRGILPEQMLTGGYYGIAVLLGVVALVLGVVAVVNGAEPEFYRVDPWIKVAVTKRGKPWSVPVMYVALIGLGVGVAMLAAPLVILALYAVAIIFAIALFGFLAFLGLSAERDKQRQMAVIAAPPPAALPPAVAEEIEVAKRHLLAGEYRSAVRDMGPSIEHAFEYRFDAFLSPIPPKKYIEMEQRFDYAETSGTLTPAEASISRRIWGHRITGTHSLRALNHEQATEVVEEMEGIIKKLYGVI